ncbi:hypothetical protein [Leifsonia sp. Leaf264]|uniref:hypothetical protein n=1 Tax=Leifsonia sp. Leaf264 TaxID=1736314 RepID=UPI0006F9E019|nr:hypothetical protein [Leifsonia sp. Leaf264]KQO98394.1 hypothetical protein ASF30_10055 [Leifsonia sp. Leaf264]
MNLKTIDDMLRTEQIEHLEAMKDLMVEIVGRNPGITVSEALRELALTAGTTVSQAKFGLSYAKNTGAVNLDFETRILTLPAPADPDPAAENAVLRDQIAAARAIITDYLHDPEADTIDALQAVAFELAPRGTR